MFTAFLCLVSGVGLLLADAVPGSLEARLSEPFLILWGVVLSVGGFLVLAATTFPDRVLSVLVERVGWFLLGGMSLVYVAALISANGKSGFLAGGYIVAFAAASFWRVGQITILIHAIHRGAVAIDLRDGN